MKKLYYNKIVNKIINPKTDEAWCINDVPSLWKAQVEELLNEQNQKW